MEIWTIYDELEELEQCLETIAELLNPHAEPSREKLALLFLRLQRQKADAMKQLHDALVAPV